LYEHRPHARSLVPAALILLAAALPPCARAQEPAAAAVRPAAPPAPPALPVPAATPSTLPVPLPLPVPAPAAETAGRPIESAATATTAAGALCPGGMISQIFVDNNSVFVVGDPDLDPRFNWAYRLANRLHIRTRESVIRRELLFREGDCYDAERLEDSERVLRAAPFIADADVFAVQQPDGSQHVIVETRDEWSTRLEPQLESGGAALTGLELREDNLFGRGQSVSAFLREYQGQRVYGGAFGTRQLLGTQLDAELGVAKTPVGVSVLQRLAWPFRGESGRWAFRQQIEHLERNFEYFVDDPLEGNLERRFFPEERTTFDVGAVLRLGRPGNLTFFGVAVAGEMFAYPEDTLSADPDDEPTPNWLLPGGGVVPGLDSVSNVRVVFLLGQRNVFFQRRRALDAVRGAEDVRLGVEAEVGIGRSLETFSDDDDVAMELGFSAAGALPGGILAGTRLVVEGKRDQRSSGQDWRDVFGQLDAWGYWRPNEDSRHTMVGALRFAGGWNTTVPFQLTLGYRSGLRGYGRHIDAGERRVVGTLEHRAYLGWPYPRLFDLGTAVFVDAGRTWDGGDPFGDDSPLQVSAGAGLRIAFPPGSRQTYRLDFAIPVSPSFRPGGLQVSFGVGQAVGRGAVEDDSQITRSSRRTLSASVFNFPN
jgi:hypothetical protein